jgi:hypothetical protein
VEKAVLSARRQAPGPNQKISVHPNLAAVYAKKVEELESLLDDEECRDEGMTLIRSMIDSITLTPRGEGPGLDTLLRGDLARMLCSGIRTNGSPRCFRARWLVFSDYRKARMAAVGDLKRQGKNELHIGCTGCR